MTISVASTSVVEGSVLAFVVTLSQPATSRVTVQYRMANGSASDDDTFNIGNTYTLTFEPGQTTATIRYDTRNDTTDEFDESVVLELFNPVGSTLAGGTPTLRATGVILDNDGPGSNTSLLVTPPTILEGDSGARSAVFEIRLSQAATVDTVVNYATFDGTAAAGLDYGATAGSLIIRAGQSVAYVSVPIVGDSVFEAAETFQFRVTSSAATLAGSSGVVVEAVLIDEDAPSNLPAVSIASARVLEGDQFAFVVTLSEPATSRVSVQYRMANGTTNNDDTFNIGNTYTLTFDPGQTVATIRYDTRNDTLDEFDESVVLELFNPVGSTLAGGVSTLRATGIILDNDGNGANVSLAGAEAVAVERGANGNGFMTFAVHLSSPSTGPVSFSYQTLPGTALERLDFTPIVGTATVPPGQSIININIPISNDDTAEVTEQFQLLLTPRSGIAGGPITITAAITDDDIVGTEGNNGLTGTARNDEIWGRGGNDQLAAGEGDDRLSGGAGSDIMDGGAGIDTAIYAGLSRGYSAISQTRVAGGREGGADTLTGIERIRFLDGTVSYETGTAVWIQDEATIAVARLYQVCLGRAPDIGGLEHYRSAVDQGYDLMHFTRAMIESPEFISRFGTLTNQQFVEQVYRFVLGREGDAGGVATYVAALGQGYTRADVVLVFSESPENKLRYQSIWESVVQRLEDGRYPAGATDEDVLGKGDGALVLWGEDDLLTLPDPKDDLVVVWDDARVADTVGPDLPAHTIDAIDLSVEPLWLGSDLDARIDWHTA